MCFWSIQYQQSVLFQAYLNSEETLGRILEGRRRDVIVATKFGTRVEQYSAEDIEKSLMTSLQRLRTDYVDLYQVSGSCAVFFMFAYRLYMSYLIHSRIVLVTGQ